MARFITRHGQKIKIEVSGLKDFQMNRISENLVDLDLELVDVREALRLKRAKGVEGTAMLEGQQKTLGGCRNSILSLVEVLPPHEHKKIIEDAEKMKKELD